MEIYIGGLPLKTSDRGLEQALKRPMSELGIYAYRAQIVRPRKQPQQAPRNGGLRDLDTIQQSLSRLLAPARDSQTAQAMRLQTFGPPSAFAPSSKPQGRTTSQPAARPDDNYAFAFVAVSTAEFAQKFIAKYGYRRQSKLRISGVDVKVSQSKSDKNRVNPYQLKSLLEYQAEIEAKHRQRGIESDQSQGRSFEISSVSCGIWSTTSSDEYNGAADMVSYISRCNYTDQGELRFRPRGIVITIGPAHEQDPNNDQPIKREITLSIAYNLLEMIVTDSQRDIMFRAYGTPRIYRQIPPAIPFDPHNQYGTQRDRILGWDSEHEAYAGLSFVYRVRLANERDHKRVLALSGRWGIPEIQPRHIPITPAPESFEKAFVGVIGAIQNLELYPFPVAYQLSSLVSNGFLPPEQVRALLPRAQRLIQEFDVFHAANILRLFRSIDVYYNVTPVYNPVSGTTEFLLNALEQSIQNYRGIYTPEQHNYVKKREQEMVNIHSIQVTPTGLLATGPRWERSNRVLRKYDEYTEYFLRVQFAEEDFEPFMGESKVSASAVYARFRQTLLEGISIAGREFGFLGFSGSGLKAATCWFVANFVKDGRLMTRERIIEELGDFAGIQVPGRWAARIGQAFSDTIRSIDVDPKWEHTIDDVEAVDSEGTNRCFSDGVGKFSQGLLDKIYHQSESIEATRSTVFQIRYGGAKGMISLDPSLPGTQLCLRPSMKKFEGSPDRNLEICTWGKVLPMFLNRPLVMVLEGLGVPQASFMEAQKIAVDRLRHSSSNAHLAANLLKRQNVSASSLRLHWCISSMSNIGIDFFDDDFLQHGYEIVLCMVLRGMKYKARIPIDQGLTLVGVLDETGYLRAGEIYAPHTDADGRRRVLGGRVVITRSPVHHPGDVQMAEAVDVPRSSPLYLLENCVVFSIHGDRPLPSMLSGGDLDGDLYNIIYDKSFRLPKTVPSAEYPPSDPLKLDKAVTLNDVAEFFTSFMKTNILGLISTRHLHIADQTSIFDERCLELAEQASIAVDFPKTGRGVEIKDVPKANEPDARPDWMAPSPRVSVRKNSELRLDAPRNQREDADEIEGSGPWYYKSTKALGRLYRAIDEKRFLEEVSVNIRSNPERRNTALARVWDYMLIRTKRLCNPGIYYQEARTLKAEWDAAVYDIRVQASETPWKGGCSESEVFFGVLLGRGAGTRRERDRAELMKSEFEETASYYVKRLKEGEREELLGRCMAVLQACLDELQTEKVRGYRESDGRSFAWVAVSVLLTEVDILEKEARRAGVGHRQRGGRRDLA